MIINHLWEFVLSQHDLKDLLKYQKDERKELLRHLYLRLKFDEFINSVKEIFPGFSQAGVNQMNRLFTHWIKFSQLPDKSYKMEKEALENCLRYIGGKLNNKLSSKDGL